MDATGRLGLAVEGVSHQTRKVKAADESRSQDGIDGDDGATYRRLFCQCRRHLPLSDSGTAARN